MASGGAAAPPGGGPVGLGGVVAGEDEELMILQGAYSVIVEEEEEAAMLLADSDSDDSIYEEGWTVEDELLLVGGPGKGNPARGFKGAYSRTPGRTPMSDAINHHDPHVLNAECGLNAEELKELHELGEEELSKQMDPRLEKDIRHRTAGRLKARLLSTMEMLYMFLFMITGSNEGSYGLSHVKVHFGVSRGTVSNVFYHVASALSMSLKKIRPSLISWPTAAMRESMRGLINGFPSVVVFVDGTKQRAWRPGDPVMQEFIFDGHHHFHSHTVLWWGDVYGRCIRLDFTLKGSMHDREIYNNSAVGQHPEQFLSTDGAGEFLERIMADSGFQGSGPIEAPHRRNQGLSFPGRGARNRDIRKQRICNEWGIGRTNNKFRLFLGRWSMSKEWFPLTYEVACSIIVFTDNRVGRELVPLSRLLERQAAYEATGGERY